MKNNTLKYLVYLGVAVVVALLVYMVYINTKHLDWNQKSLKENDKDPYGAYLFYELMKDYRTNDTKNKVIKPLYSQLEMDEKGSYLFLGNTSYLLDQDFDSLSAYVAKGNNALFISNFSSEVQNKIRVLDSTVNIVVEELESEYDAIDESFFKDSDTLIYKYKKSIFGYDFPLDSTVLVSIHKPIFNRKEYSFTYRDEYGTTNFLWYYVDKKFIRLESVESIGVLRLSDSSTVASNFIKIQYGKGAFYFHTNPILFSNYFLSKEEGVGYAEEVLSVLSEGDIWVDMYSKTNHYKYNKNRGRFSNSPLRYFLGEPSLAWAWYIGLFLVVMYVLFQSKRKQRIIPFIPQKKNVSLAHANAIGRLYFLNQGHSSLAKEKLKLFTHFMFKRYQIKLGKWDEEQLKLIEIKTKKSRGEVKNLAAVCTYIKNTRQIDVSDLNRLENAIKNFYT
ncbi:MAG: DUF4350 domain-containing protein [Cyclobacteriaceae bacterium]